MDYSQEEELVKAKVALEKTIDSIINELLLKIFAKVSQVLGKYDWKPDGTGRFLNESHPSYIYEFEVVNLKFVPKNFRLYLWHIQDTDPKKSFVAEVFFHLSKDISINGGGSDLFDEAPEEIQQDFISIISCLKSKLPQEEP